MYNAAIIKILKTANKIKLFLVTRQCNCVAAYRHICEIFCICTNGKKLISALQIWAANYKQPRSSLREF